MLFSKFSFWAREQPMYGLKYLSLETEFESRFEFVLFNLNNCIEKLNLNGIIWNWIYSFETEFQ